MQWIALFMVSTLSSIVFLKDKPNTANIDCKYAKEYAAMLEYCNTGVVPADFPPAFKGMECNADMIRVLRNQNTVCNALRKP